MILVAVAALAYWYIDYKIRGSYDEMKKYHPATAIEKAPDMKAIEEKMEQARARLKRG